MRSVILVIGLCLGGVLGSGSRSANAVLSMFVCSECSEDMIETRTVLNSDIYTHGLLNMLRTWARMSEEEFLQKSKVGIAEGHAMRLDSEQSAQVRHKNLATHPDEVSDEVALLYYKALNDKTSLSDPPTKGSKWSCMFST